MCQRERVCRQRFRTHPHIDLSSLLATMPPKSSMTKGDSQRIQSSQAKGGRDMSSSGFASRAQSAGDRAQNAAPTTSSKGTGGGSTGKGSGGGSGGGGKKSK
ncbi:hypothetical protein C8F01DRAFT_1158658 [Mycena amicta]|nr:hypothetical protein C8F01DRAFT_1158658 [Mycena amicta]